MSTERTARTLGDLVTLQRGTTYKSRLLGLPGPVLLGLGSIARNGGFRMDSVQTYGGECAEKLLLGPGDLYVSLKDVTQSADLLGAVARVPRGITSGRLTQDTVRLDLLDGDVPSDYIYWLLRTPQYRSYCRERATGTTNLSLSRDDFLSFPVPHPTCTRLALVAVLEALEECMRVNERIAQTVYELIQALWWEAAGRAEGVASVGSVADLDKGLSYKGAGLGSGVPLVNLGNFGTDGRFKESHLKRYDGEAKARHWVAGGDLVMANTDLTQRREILGQPALIPASIERAIYSHHVFALRPHSALSEDTLWLYGAFRTKTFRDRAVTYATGTTVVALPRDAVLNYELPWPERSIRRTWARKVQSLIDAVAVRVGENGTLSRLREALLSQLVSGFFRAPDVENAGEDAA